MPPTPDQIREAAIALKARREARTSLARYYDMVYGPLGYKAAKHHTLLMDKIQSVIDRTLIHSKTGDSCSRLMVLMPPGSAKSVITSILTPPWFLQRRAETQALPKVLSCSHSADLVEGFSRQCRNNIEADPTLLGFELSKDSRSVQEWSVQRAGKLLGSYKCLGVGAGLSGYRGDLGLIDDYVGKQEDADSQLIRDKTWDWWLADFDPRLKPGAVRIIVANRRHEDDLVGRILLKEAKKWETIVFPMLAEEDDVLGRKVGDRLWPEYFTEEMAETAKSLPPRIFSGLYQQRPSPEEGAFFLKEWMRTYNREEYDSLMKRGPRIYGAGDWAVSEEKDANRTCFGGVAVDENKIIYVLPDLFWKTAGPKEVVQSYVDFLKRRKPIQFRSEKGHISKAWGPFLRDAMQEANTYCYIEEVTPSKAKDVRAQTTRGLMSMHRFRFPDFASWWPAAMHEMLMFPGGTTDDFCDFLAHIGALVNDMIRLETPRVREPEDLKAHRPITLEWVKKSHQEQIDSKLPRYAGR